MPLQKVVETRELIGGTNKNVSRYNAQESLSLVDSSSPLGLLFLKKIQLVPPLHRTIVEIWHSIAYSAARGIGSDAHV